MTRGSWGALLQILHLDQEASYFASVLPVSEKKAAVWFIDYSATYIAHFTFMVYLL